MERLPTQRNSLLLATSLVVLSAGAQSFAAAPDVLLRTDFGRGLAAPWTTGQNAAGRATWWNSGRCNSRTSIDRQVRRRSTASLHIVNRSSRAPHVYGTTQRLLAVEPNRCYRIILWACARSLASTGGVSIVVDRRWQVRPIHFPKGTYDWAPLTGLFSLPSSSAQLRILSEDRGEVWIDEIVILPEPSSRNNGEGPSPVQPLTVAGFDRGLRTPWGTGHYSKGRSVWWNSGGCRSRVERDRSIKRQGSASLHIANPSRRSAHVFGTTQQPVDIEPGRQYRITLWARAKKLASTGGVSIVVDRQWRVRPLVLPRGTYDWAQFTGVFSLPERTAQLRILSDDVGEVWIDDLRIEPVTSVARTMADLPKPPTPSHEIPRFGQPDTQNTQPPEGDPGRPPSEAGVVEIENLPGVWQASFLSMEMTVDGSAHHLQGANAPTFRFEISRRGNKYVFQILDRQGLPRELVQQGDEFAARSSTGKPDIHLVSQGAALYGNMTIQGPVHGRIEFHAQRAEPHR